MLNKPQRFLFLGYFGFRATQELAFGPPQCGTHNKLSPTCLGGRRPHYTRFGISLAGVAENPREFPGILGNSLEFSGIPGNSREFSKIPGISRIFTESHRIPARCPASAQPQRGRRAHACPDVSCYGKPCSGTFRSTRHRRKRARHAGGAAQTRCGACAHTAGRGPKTSEKNDFIFCTCLPGRHGWEYKGNQGSTAPAGVPRGPGKPRKTFSRAKNIF